MLTDAITALVTRYLDPRDLLAWLLVFMFFDIVTGVIASFRERRLNSSIMWAGMWKKVATVVAMVFLIVVDPFIRAYGQGFDPHVALAATLMFVGVEVVSILENLGRSGVKTDLLARYFSKVTSSDPPAAPPPA